MKFAFQLLTILATLSASFAHPIHDTPRELTIVGPSQSSKREVPPASGGGAPSKGTIVPEFQLLADGNKAFRDELTKDSPVLLKTLTDEGQAPPFMFIGCSDSRASEGTIFSAKPGTLFTERNIANQFFATDPNTHAVVSYAVAVLGVKHVIVMGHYGCGGVAAAIASPPTASVDAASGSVQAWIEPIREIFRTSSRPEIVQLREKIKGQTNVEEPDIQEPGFRALVEENVKAGVKRIATDSVIANHYAALAAASSPSNTNTTATSPPTKRADHHGSATPSEVYIHGWVYDIENGVVRDLGISVGPPGKTIPTAPWDAVVSAATTSSHENVNANKVVGGENVKERCEQLCKAKRFFLGRSV